MITSKYNFIFPYQEGTYLAYNSLTNDLAVLEKNEYEEYEHLRKNGETIKSQELIKNLSEGGFIYLDEVNETDIVRMKRYRSRFGEKSLALTIAPTSDCNFKCIYCFEKNVIQPIYMNEEVENNIIQYVKNKILDIKHISICWYGGEPLLGYESIKRISKAVIKICEENHVTYSAGMSTNGYLLSEERVRELTELKVEHYQITIDGGCQVHNKRRGLKNGVGSYDTILKNLKMLTENDEVSISIRMNVDKDNVRDIYDVLEMVESISQNDNVNCYLGHVDAIEGCYGEETCLSNEEYTNLSKDFSELLKEKNLPPIYYEEYPQTLLGGCIATTGNGLLINADGRIYKCWNEIGDESHCVGDINDPEWEEKYRSEYMKFMAYDPMADEECSDCKYLPLCMGGCPYKRINHIERCYYKGNDHVEQMVMKMANTILESEAAEY